MNHPLKRFHRPSTKGLRDAMRGQRLASHRLNGSTRVPSPDAVAWSLEGKRPVTARREPCALQPAIVPPKSVEKPRWRWYQYSIRSLLVLMLLVSLFMSWYATKMKRAIAQRKAVAAIMEAGGSVQYEHEFDVSGMGQLAKGAKGPGPQWLRNLLGADYFDTVVHATADSAEGVDAINEFATLPSIEIDTTTAGENVVKRLRDVAGLEELTITGPVNAAGLERIGSLRHLRRLSIANNMMLDVDLDEESSKKLYKLLDLTRLQPCIELRELTILCEGFSNDGRAVSLVSGIERLHLMPWGMRLEKLSLAGCGVKSSDVRFLGKLSKLRELDLSQCPGIDDEAAQYLREMKGLKKLDLRDTKVSTSAAEGIDDALPDCIVLY